MRYYIDKDFRLHLNNNDNMISWDDENCIFDGKCQNFIEGFRVIPKGMTWMRSDGEKFSGLMIAPWKNSKELIFEQKNYETEQIIAELDAALLDATYENIIGGI